jgi:hypothetical protein
MDSGCPIQPFSGCITTMPRRSWLRTRQNHGEISADLRLVKSAKALGKREFLAVLPQVLTTGDLIVFCCFCLDFEG